MPILPKFRQSIESTNMSTGSDPVQGACAHTSCNYVENLKASVLQLPSVLRLEDATELQFPCTSRHDCVKILKLVLKNRSVPKMAWSLDDSVLGSSYFWTSWLMQEVFWLDHALAVPNDYKVGTTPVLNSKFNMNRSTIFGQSVLGHSIEFPLGHSNGCGAYIKSTSLFVRKRSGVRKVKLHLKIGDSCTLKEYKSVTLWINTKVLQSSLPNLGMIRVWYKMEKTNEMKQTKGPNCTRLVDSGNKVHDLDKYGSRNCDVIQNGFRPMFGNIHS